MRLQQRVHVDDLVASATAVTSSRTSEHDDHMAFNSMGEFTVVVNKASIENLRMNMIGGKVRLTSFAEKVDEGAKTDTGLHLMGEPERAAYPTRAPARARASTSTNKL